MRKRSVYILILGFIVATMTVADPNHQCADCRAQQNAGNQPVAQSESDTVANLNTALAKALEPQKGTEPLQINISGTNVYYSNNRIVGGTLNDPAKCPKARSDFQYCGRFAKGSRCHTFENTHYASHGGTGELTSSATALPADGKGALSGVSTIETGAKLKLLASPGSDAKHANFQGQLTIPGGFLVANPTLTSATPIIGMAVDLHVSGKQITRGGVLVYTSKDDKGCYSGFLLAL